MFYVSNISGSQIPYDPEAFRISRLAAEESSRAEISRRSEELAANRVEGEDVATDAASSLRSARESESTGAPLTTPVPATGQAIGLAGASVLNRTETDKRVRDLSARDSSGDPQADLTRPPVSGVDASTAVEVESDQTEDRRHSSRRRASPTVNPYEKIDRNIPQRKPALLAEQIMSSPVVSLHPEDRVAEAWQLIAERRFRHIPVTSQEAKLVGIVSDRVFIQLASQIQHELKFAENLVNQKVSQIMTTGVLSARPETPIREIARVLFQERVGAMPIVNEKEQLVGLLTRSDILRTVMNLAPLELWT